MASFVGNGTKVKIPSEIKPPLEKKYMRKTSLKIKKDFTNYISTEILAYLLLQEVKKETFNCCTAVGTLHLTRFTHG